MNLGSDNFKEIALDALKGHWPGAVLTGVLAVWLGAFAFSVGSLCEYIGVTSAAIWYFESFPNYLFVFLAVVTLLSLFYFFVGGVIRLGYIDYNLALLDRREAGCKKLFSHFEGFWKVILARITLFFILSLTTLLFIIPGIISLFTYSMVPYILEEKPGFTVSQAFRASRRIMQGHKWQLFKLRLSFLGWDLLGLLTGGIAYLFIVPYMNLAEAVFYNEISGRADAYYRRGQEEAGEEEPEEEALEEEA